MRERVIDKTEHKVYASLGQFQSAPQYPSGVLTVMNGGLPIDIRYEPRGHDVTTVFFHAALTGGPYQFPVFIGAGISEHLPTNRIFIADPTLYLDDRLNLGWYAGNSKQPRLQWVIRGIINALVPDSQRLVTFGSSGGGFAALYYAAHRHNATAVPVNPQTNIAKYLPASIERYAKLGWGLSGTTALQEMTAVTDLTKVYRSSTAKVLYVQNRNDGYHMAQHYKPFMSALPEVHDVHQILPDGPNGHKAPDKAIIRATLEAAVAGHVTPPGPLQS